MSSIKKATALLITTAIIVFALNGFATVQANRNLMIENPGNFHVYINGDLTILRDVEGNIIEPLMIYDTIYLPLRAVSEVFGEQIRWDNDTNTAIIGESPSNLTASPRGVAQVSINGELVQLQDKIYIRNGILFVALVDIHSIFGLTGRWEPTTSSIIIGERPQRFLIYVMNENVINQKFSISMNDFTEWELQNFSAYPRGVARNFTGISLKTIFKNLGISVENATGVVFRAEDGFSVMIPWDEAIDDQNTFIAIKEDGELFGARHEGGSGPFRSVIALDPFSNRWCRYLTIIIIHENE